MINPAPDMPNTISEAATLRLLVEGTAGDTGTAFFRSLVRNLAQALDTCAAWVTEYVPEEQKLRALAMWLNGAFVEHFEYCVRGTPCEPVVTNKTLIHFPDRIIELFPLDAKMLTDVGAVSFMGLPLIDLDGSVLGHLAILDSKPMPEDSRKVALFEVFAARAAAEHRRLKAELKLKASEQQLSLLIESALDAIVVFSEQFEIVRVNRAAERLLGCTAEDLLGEGIRDFLVPESAARVERFAREIEDRPEGRQQLWVPQDFVIRRWDHSVFPAEATLSRFASGAQVFFTLILRNADERIDAERQIQALLQETQYLREAVRELPGLGELLGASDGMKAVAAAIKQVAPTDSTVLIHGETGTGKELVARSLHRASLRANQPLIIVNCAAIPANLIESEFFGHEKGAFTGAVNRREGRFALADGGTIFLDEIGELPFELQAKLLRVLQEGEFEPLGSARTRKVDVRILAATHRDLKQLVSGGKFREDLYFRLNVFPIHLPPLRERARDLEQLADVFVQRFARRLGRQVRPLSSEQRKLLRSYNWPGNVRELQNVIERAVILTASGDLRLEQALGGVDGISPFASATPTAVGSDEAPRVRTAREMAELERANILLALNACDGRVSGEAGAARLLGIPASTLSSRMKALGIERS